MVELVGIEPTTSIVANDGVHQLISLTRLHQAAEYGPLRSNSTIFHRLPGFASKTSGVARRKNAKPHTTRADAVQVFKCGQSWRASVHHGGVCIVAHGQSPEEARGRLEQLLGSYTRRREHSSHV